LNPLYDKDLLPEPNPEEEIYEVTSHEQSIWIAVSMTISQKIKEQTDWKEREKTFEELVPPGF